MLALATGGVAAGEEQVAEPKTTEEYVDLARRFLPKDEKQVIMAERYVLLTPTGRETFKIRNARTRVIEYQAYAICYYKAVEGGMRNDLAGFRCYDRFIRKYVP